MASLLAWLADSGARTSSGAPVASGYAWFYQPGTTDTQVTVFSDADGLYPVTQPARLDAGGRVAVYADAALQVLIQDSTRVTVRLHDRGNTVTAAQVEIENAVATGTSLTTGAQVAGGRTDLNTYLTNVRASMGTTNGNVLLGTVSMALKDAIKPLSRIYDVTAVPYGAAGDGITNDTIAVQAAITAADAVGGGIVLIPPGTFLVNSLTIPSNVSLLGAGSGKSIVETTSASLALLVTAGAFNAQGVKFKTTGKALLSYTAVAPNSTVFTACAFECTNAATVSVVDAEFSGSVNVLTFVGCDFVQTGAGGTQAFLDGGCTVIGGTITFASGHVVDGSFMKLDGVIVEYTGAGTSTFFGASSADLHNFTDCVFTSSGGGTLDLNAGSYAVEKGCYGAFGSGVFRSSELRDSSSITTTISAALYAPTPLYARTFFITSTNAAFEWDAPTGASQWPGYDLMLWYKNTSGGAVTPTLDPVFKGTAVSVANNSACGWLFTWNGSLSKYVQIGSVIAYAS